MSALSLRQKLAQELDPKLRREAGISTSNKWIIGLILISLLIATLETEQTIYQGREWLFWSLEAVLIVVFSIEYIARVWSSVENPDYPSRWRYMLSFSALLDLITLIAIILATFGASAFLLRLARVLRVLRIARLGRFSSALTLIQQAIYHRRYELGISFMAAMAVLFASSVILYLLEGGQQPEEFGSIPRAMWWSIVTLTTVGYGDVYPITALGRVFAALTALTGIALIAMPTGILAGAISEALQQAREAKQKRKQSQKTSSKP